MKEFSFKINGTAYQVSVDEPKNGKAQVTVNGKPFSVEMEEKKSPAAVRAAQAPAAASQAVSGVIASPLPGNVMKVLVSNGQTVKAGDTMLVVESMKMENNIPAPGAGVVRSVMVQAGQSIMQGDPLVDFEAAAAPVAAERPAPKPAAAPSPAAPAPVPAAAPASAKAVTSPLPGSVLSVKVKVGDTVKAGDVIAVIESMKMENNIPAPRGGQVTAVYAEAGKSVLQGDALLDIE